MPGAGTCPEKLGLMVRTSSPGSGLCSKGPTVMTMLAKKAHFLWHGFSFMSSHVPQLRDPKITSLTDTVTLLV